MLAVACAAKLRTSGEGTWPGVPGGLYISGKRYGMATSGHQGVDFLLHGTNQVAVQAHFFIALAQPFR